MMTCLLYSPRLIVIMKNRIAIIPARGGSKRIPRKNIKSFLGKPIISYPIQTLLASALFDRVIVSTDDEEIASIAKQFGAEVPFLRSRENSSDTAGTLPVIEEVVRKEYDSKKIPFTICCVYPTSVFVTTEHLNQAIQLLENNHYKSVVAITKFGHPIQRAIELNEDLANFYQPENRLVRTQDLRPYYHDTGQLYVLQSNILLTENSLFTDFTGYIDIPEFLVQDIDYPDDWSIAEFKYKLLEPFNANHKKL